MRPVMPLPYLLLAGALCVGVFGNRAAAAPPPVTVVITGDEQGVVERYASDWKRPEPSDFDNALDLVHAVLIQRGDPTPDAGSLRREAVQAMSRIWSEQASAAAPGSEEELSSAWLQQAEESGSFAALLRDASWESENARRKGLDAGIQAMLGTTGWLLPRDQAESIRKMMAARKQGELERPGAPASFVLRRLQPGVIHLQIPTFEDPSIGRRIVKALHKELRAGADTVLIDLRDNPGGQPEQANAVADVFLDQKTLQIMRFRDGRLVKIVSRPGASDVTVVVLVNRNTGSAAEMLAMALRDNGRGTLIGQRTGGVLYGKDGVDLPGGRMVLFRCEPTILSPSEANYTDRGIPPHKMIDANQSATDVMLQKAQELGRAGRKKSW